MKKLTLCIVILTMLQTAVYSQDYKLGAKAGINFANLTGDFQNGKTRTSIHLGGVAEFRINDLFAVQPELLYSGQGANADNDDNNVVKINYITIPVIAKYFVTESLTIEAGPQVGFLASAKSTVDGNTTDIKEFTKSMDLGFNLGLGYVLDQGVFFGARYYFGSDINDAPNSTMKIKNGVFQLSAGYYFK